MQVFEYPRPEGCNAVMAEVSANSMGEFIRQTPHLSQPHTLRQIWCCSLGICFCKHVLNELKQELDGPGDAQKYKSRLGLTMTRASNVAKNNIGRYSIRLE